MLTALQRSSGPVCPPVSYLFRLVRRAGRAADDQWRPGFIDKDIVSLVDKREVMAALDERARPYDARRERRPGRKEGSLVARALTGLETVAEEVETELRSGSVSDVATVRSGTIGVLHLGLQHAH